MAVKKRPVVGVSELLQRPAPLAQGHRMCSGCSLPIVVNLALRSADTPVVVASPTGCLEITTSVYPHSAWNVPWFHSAFENAASTISGIEGAYKALVRKGKLPQEQRIKFVVIGGDGGTYDIGIQALSGAAERGHDFVYICTNNEGYQNTGNQRSGATTFAGQATTSPVGKVHRGKEQKRKNLTFIMAAHEIPYAAQATPFHFRDFIAKMRKALSVEGPAFLNVYQPCVSGWRFEADQAFEMCQLAVQTCLWPLYAVEDGRRWRITHKPAKKKPLEEWVKPQGRLRHLLRSENRDLLEELQRQVDEEWEFLLRMERATSDGA